jgi:ribosomal protein S12 methylthiotransferase accessory factor
MVLPAQPEVRYRDQRLRARKQFWHGTHRTVSPVETLERLRPFFGVAGVTRLADITGLDRIGIPTVLAHRPNAPTLSNAAGKGYTREAAAVSAAMEAIEVYHAENVRLKPEFASYAAIRERYPVMKPEQLPLTKRPLFRESRPERWLLGWDLVAQREAAVPFGSVAMAIHPDERPLRWMPFAMGTNGLAGGNDFVEALNAALLEVVERDAVTCHRVALQHGHALAAIQLSSIQSPVVRDLVDRLRRAEILPVLYDCTVDTDVPCYMALIYDERLRNVGVHRGYGAHLDPDIAMTRALTEAVQSRLILIAGSRDDFFRQDQRVYQFSDTTAAFSATTDPALAVAAPVRASQATDEFGEDVNIVVEKLARCGIEQVVVLDLSHEEIGVPVVRVVVPGLEGYMFDHYAPGPRARAFLERANVRGGCHVE